MKILDLVVKYQWYDMENSGEKPEEYRDLSDKRNSSEMQLR